MPSLKEIRGIIDPARIVPTELNQTERDRHEQYVIFGHHYDPPADGLYRGETDDGTYLYLRLKWTNDVNVGNPNLDPDTQCFFNPIQKIVDIDVASQMNEFTPEGFEVLQEKTTETDASLTNFVRDVILENDPDFLFQETFGIAAVKSDAYQRVYQDPYGETQNGIVIETYSPNIVYPVLMPGSLRREAAFRIFFRAYAPSKVGILSKYLRMETTEDHLEIITPEGSMYTVDSIPQGNGANMRQWALNGPEDNFMPFIHYGHQIFDDYYGIGVPKRLIEPMAAINTLMTRYWYAGKQTGTCQTYYTGERQIQDFYVGKANYAYYLGTSGSMDSLSFPIDGSHLEFLKLAIDTIRQNDPHYESNEAQSSRSARRPETSAAMMSNFTTYAEMLQNAKRGGLRKLANAILRVAGKTSKPRRIKINMGSPVSEAIMSKLEALNQEAALVANIKTIGQAERVAEELHYDETQKQELIDQANRSTEVEDEKRASTPAAIMKRAAEERERRETITIKAPQQEGQSDGKSPQIEKINIYQIAKAIEENAATAIDLRVAIFGEDRATARQRVEESTRFNIDMAKQKGEVQGIEKSTEIDEIGIDPEKADMP